MRRVPSQIRSGLDLGLQTKRGVKAKNIPLNTSFHNTPPMSGNLLDSETYDRHLSTLEKQEEKVSKNNALIATLMKETTTNRRTWILDEKPSVLDILKRFPQLATYSIVRQNTIIHCINHTFMTMYIYFLFYSCLAT